MDKDFIIAAYPDYIDYLCTVGETLVTSLNYWRNSDEYEGYRNAG
jgi:hypothetical protein